MAKRTRGGNRKGSAFNDSVVSDGEFIQVKGHGWYKKRIATIKGK